MSTKEQQKTISALWPVAQAAALHIREWHVPERLNADARHFHPSVWDGGIYVAAAFSKPGQITYRLKGGAKVTLKNIEASAVSPDDVYVGPIEPTGDQRVVKSEIISTLNDTLNDVPWKLTHRDLISTTAADKVAKEVGASLAVGLRQQVGYGSEIAQISGETELTVNMEASVKAAWEREMTSHRESEVTGERDILISALHRGRLERVETVGPAKQIIRAQGLLGFGLHLHSPGHFWAEWDNLSDFMAMLQGIDAKRSFNAGDWIDLYRGYPVYPEKLIPFQQKVHAESEKVREFEEASNIDVVIRSEPINDQARLLDALKLLSTQEDDRVAGEIITLAQSEYERLTYGGLKAE